jgi:type I restriction enzyme M protein
VRRPTITTWAKRHENFPQPVHLADGDYFILASVLGWLDRRPIPAKERSADETPGFTYGQRARRRSHRAEDDAAPVHADSFDVASTEQILEELLGPLATKVRGGMGSQADYVNLLLCLVFLRGCTGQRWSDLRSVTGSRREELRPGEVLRRIGVLTDQTLRLYGILPGAQTVLERLRPRSTADLVEVMRLCDGLGPDAFDPLRDRFAAETRLRSADFFTPDEVAFLMASLAVSESDNDATVYDPYLRGGELLRAASFVRPTSNQPLVQGESPNRETLRIAGMNLALHGQPAELQLGSSAPWDDPGKPRSLAGAVVLNPPFNVRAALTRRRPDTGWLFGPPSPHGDNYAWIQYAIAALRPDGTAAVLMPYQAAVSSDEHEHWIRREMVEQGAVKAIVALPPQLFPSTDVAVTLWIVGPPTGFPSSILFVDARKMSSKLRTRQALTSGAVKAISKLYSRRRLLQEGDREELPGSGLGVSVGIDALRRTSYSLNPSDYMEGSLGVTSQVPPGGLADSLDELAILRSRVSRADSRVEALRPFPHARSSSALPSGWGRLPLAELCEIQAGPSYSRLGTEKRAEHGSVPIVMPRHLRDRRIVATDADKTTDEIARQLAKFHLSVNDILCVRSGAMSEPAIVGEQQDGWLFGTNLLRLRLAASDAVDPLYLLGFLSLPTVLGWIRGRSSGTAIPSISTRSLGQLMVTVPPLDKQRHIGSALLAFDEQIAMHQKFLQAAARARTTVAEHLMEGAVTLQ